jgi:RHS repeat-associated protein
VAYVVDGQNRRVGKQVNGTTTEGLLYQDQLNVIAQLNPNGTVASRFVFGSKPNVPDYYATSAGTYRILSDHLGSPRLIVNTANGSVVEEIDYDEFGNVTNDTAPGTIPFGFAGGLNDLDTGLVRFGARDYDPSVGRWTSKDPTRFDGGQVNFYVYLGDDPVNSVDPTGFWGGGGESGGGGSSGSYGPPTPAPPTPPPPSPCPPPPPGPEPQGGSDCFWDRAAGACRPRNGNCYRRGGACYNAGLNGCQCSK